MEVQNIKQPDKEAHLLQRASHAEAHAAATGDPETRQSWATMAVIYRQLAAIAARNRQKPFR